MRSWLLCLLFSCAASKPQPAPAADPAASAPADRPAALSAAAECASDADCSLTYAQESDCCANLCAPRVVTAAHAAELKAQADACDHACPRRACAPPRFRTVPACAEGRCVGRSVKLDD